MLMKTGFTESDSCVLLYDMFTFFILSYLFVTWSPLVKFLKLIWVGLH